MSTPTDRGDVSGGQAFFDAEDGDEEQSACEDADDDADYYDPIIAAATMTIS